MCGTISLAHGLKNEVYSCVAQFLRLMDQRMRYIHV